MKINTMVSDLISVISDNIPSIIAFVASIIVNYFTSKKINKDLQKKSNMSTTIYKIETISTKIIFLIENKEYPVETQVTQEVQNLKNNINNLAQANKKYKKYVSIPKNIRKELRDDHMTKYLENKSENLAKNHTVKNIIKKIQDELKKLDLNSIDPMNKSKKT